MILRPGEAGVAHRAADDELAGRVAVEEILVAEQALLVVQVRRQDRAEHVLGEVGLDQRVGVEPVAVLRRDQHADDLDGADVPCSSVS